MEGNSKCSQSIQGRAADSWVLSSSQAWFCAIEAITPRWLTRSTRSCADRQPIKSITVLPRRPSPAAPFRPSDPIGPFEFVGAKVHQHLGLILRQVINPGLHHQIRVRSVGGFPNGAFAFLRPPCLRPDGSCQWIRCKTCRRSPFLADGQLQIHAAGIEDGHGRLSKTWRRKTQAHARECQESFHS